LCIPQQVGIHRRADGVDELRRDREGGRCARGSGNVNVRRDQTSGRPGVIGYDGLDISGVAVDRGDLRGYGVAGEVVGAGERAGRHGHEDVGPSGSQVPEHDQTDRGDSDGQDSQSSALH